MWREILYLILLHTLSVKSDCTISIKGELATNISQPLLLDPKRGSGINAFYPSDSSGIITVNNSQSIDVACPGHDIVVNGMPIESNPASVECINRRFEVNGIRTVFRDIACDTRAANRVRRLRQCLNSTYYEVEIGFSLPSGFLELIKICFDPHRQIALYAEHVLKKTIAGRQTYSRTSWLQGNNIFAIRNVDKFYDRNKQRTIINGLLGLNASSYKFIADSSDYYLSRGHLTPQADFIYGSQQVATFYLINAIPQWQIINKNNWYKLEEDIRKFTARKGLDLTIYTGTYGVTTLPYQNTSTHVELYLYVEGNTKRIPVPRLIWKAIYDNTTNAGVVFIGVNNPYLITSADKICNDICHQYSWLTWNVTDRSLGYGYCCRVDDFRRTVKTFPDIKVTRLLK